MKRFTFLAAIAFAVSMTANAQVWEDDLKTVDSADDYVRSAPMTMDENGNTIVTGRYSLQDNLQFGLYTFTGVTANDAFIGKYDSKGLKQWVAGINGNAVITAVTTDEEGNIYAAGKFAAEAKVCGTSGEAQTITDGDATNTSRTSSFIVKYDKDGVVKSVKTLIPAKDTSFFNDNPDLWDTMEPNVTISNIQADGDKVYFSLTYKGNVTMDGTTFEGHYANAWGMLIQDLSTAAIVSVDANELGSPSVVASLGAVDKVSYDVSYQPEDVCFTVDNGVVYAGFTGEGSLALTTAAGTENISLTYGEEAQEHAFIFARIEGDKTLAKTYNTTATTNINILNSIGSMRMHHGKLLVAGTFNVEGLFDGLEFKGGCDLFAASLNPSDLTLNTAKASGYDEGDAKKNAEVFTTMFSDGEELYVVGYAETTADNVYTAPLGYTIDPTTCEFTDKKSEVYLTASAENDDYLTCQYDDDRVTNSYTCTAKSTEDGINEVADNGQAIERKGDEITASAATDFAVYAADGALVKTAKASSSISLAGLGKGVYVVKAGQKTVKVSK